MARTVIEAKKICGWKPKGADRHCRKAMEVIVWIPEDQMHDVACAACAKKMGFEVLGTIKPLDKGRTPKTLTMPCRVNGCKRPATWFGLWAKLGTDDKKYKEPMCEWHAKKRQAKLGKEWVRPMKFGSR